MDWSQVSAIATTMTACFSLGAALLSLRSTNIMKKQQENIIAPALGLIDGYTVAKDNCNSSDDTKNELDIPCFPAFLTFENQGQGPGSLLAVDLDHDNIRCDISTPVSVRPGERTQVKIWLRTPNVEYKIRLGIYYWDMNSKCYGTQMSLLIRYNTPINHQYRGRLDWRVSSERLITSSEKRPTRIVHWHPPKKLFDKSILQLERFVDSPNINI